MKENDWKSEDIWVNYCFLPDNVVSLPNRNLRSKTLNVGSKTLNGGSKTLNVGSKTLNEEFIEEQEHLIRGLTVFHQSICFIGLPTQ